MRLFLREAVKHPMLIPRKHAISMMLVKKVRNTTVDAKNRMQDSSKNRIKKLTNIRSTYAPLEDAVCAALARKGTGLEATEAAGVVSMLIAKKCLVRSVQS